MITRIWQGWTTPANAEAYEHLLTSDIFPGILAKCHGGLRSIELARREAGAETEFLVMIRFEDADSIRAMTGGTMDEAYVPPAARKLLARYETTARHFETRFATAAAPERENA